MYFNPKDFGKRLQLARKTAGLTQQALADKVSVERKHISQIKGVRHHAWLVTKF